MLPKQARLNLKKEYRWMRTGQVVRTGHFLIYIKPSENTLPRIGIATSSKTFKKAHERNKARRVTSAIIENIYDTLPGKFNIMVIPGVEVISENHNQIAADLKEGFKKAKMI